MEQIYIYKYKYHRPQELYNNIYAKNCKGLIVKLWSKTIYKSRKYPFS